MIYGNIIQIIIEADILAQIHFVSNKINLTYATPVQQNHHLYSSVGNLNKLHNSNNNIVSVIMYMFAQINAIHIICTDNHHNHYHKQSIE